MVSMTISDKLHLAAQKWNLLNISPIYKQEKRAVYQATASAWGNIILKINADTETLLSEFRALQSMHSTNCCKVYDFDEAYGMLVEELISPGTVLREEKNLAKRIKHFCTVFHNIHTTPISVADTGHKTYLNWLENADRFCQQHAADTKYTAVLELKKNMYEAYQIGKELFEKYPDRLLLHGDLHHDNILQNANGEYCIIDPKGIIGPEIFDIPRFILNELYDFDYDKAAEAISHIEMTIQLISDTTGYPIKDITRLFFMETMLANAWCLEDGVPLEALHIKVATELLRNYGGIHHDYKKS